MLLKGTWGKGEKKTLGVHGLLFSCTQRCTTSIVFVFYNTPSSIFLLYSSHAGKCFQMIAS